MRRKLTNGPKQIRAALPRRCAAPLIGGILSALCLSVLWLLAAAPVIAHPLPAPAAQSSSPAELWVDPSTGSDSNPCARSAACSTIGRALALAGPDDIIRVAQGTYFESLTIPFSVTVIGGYAPGFGQEADPPTDPDLFQTRITGIGGRAITIQGQIEDTQPPPPADEDPMQVTLRGLHLVDGNRGGLYIYSSGGTVNGIPTRPHAVEVTLEQVVIEGNSSVDDGGGIYITGPDNKITIQGGAIRSNTATNGGGIYAEGSYVEASGELTVSDNHANTNGGAIYLAASTVMTVTTVTLTDNSATLDGGGLYLDQSTFTALDATYADANSATTGAGGAIYAAEGSHASLGKADLHDNRAATDGGGLYSAKAIVNLGDGSTVADNVAQSGGGFYVSGGELNLAQIDILRNQAQLNGGGLYLTGDAALTLAPGGRVALNSAQTGSGGGLYADGGAATLTGVTVEQNSAHIDGGGLYQTGGDLTVEHSADIIANSTESGSGGGVAVISGTVTIDNSLVRQNNAFSDGGGLYALGSAVTLTNSAVIDANSAAGGRGGGVYVDGVRLEATDATFTANEADQGGGGLYATTLFARVAQSTLEGNNGGSGPGGAAYFSADQVVLEGNHATSNETAGNGGAFAIEESAVAVTGNTIQSNLVRRDITTTVTVLEEDVIIEQTGQIVRRAGETVITTEATEGTGGALHLLNTSGNFGGNFILNNRNDAGEGGGLYVRGGVITMTNSVIAQNSVALSTTYGTGIYVLDSNMALYHVTLADNANRAAQEGGG